MDLTNDTYTVFISNGKVTESYFRDEKGWVKVSTRGRIFRMTAEQVLNHVLPAIAGIKPGVTIRVEHHEERGRKTKEAGLTVYPAGRIARDE
jgi:hypothetical protein